MLISLYCCLFWWNPLTRFLKKDLERHIEIRCDLSTVKNMSVKEVKKYLQTIVNVLRISEKKERSEFVGIVALASNIECELTERFQIIVENQNKKKSILKTVIYTFVFAAVFILSYSFMPRPAFEPSIKEIKTEQETIYLQQETTYILHAKNGKYKLIQGGINYGILSEQELLQYVNGILDQKNTLLANKDGIIKREMYSKNSIFKSESNETDYINVNDYMEINDEQGMASISASKTLGTIKYSSMATGKKKKYGLRCSYTSKVGNGTYTIKSFAGKVVDFHHNKCNDFT